MYDNASAALDLAKSHLKGADNHMWGLLTEACIVRDSRSEKPCGLIFSYNPDTGRHFNFNITPEWMELSVDDIATRFTKIVYDAIGRGELPSEPMP
jgi:hypothetical protein